MRVGWERVEVSEGMDGRREGRSRRDASSLRSSACMPMAVAGRGVGSDRVLMMPRGRLAREKSVLGGVEGTQVGTGVVIVVGVGVCVKLWVGLGV